MSCPDCNLATHLLQELHCLLKSARDLHALSELELERLSFALEESESRLSKYIGHRVRTIHQNAVPGKEISDMGYTEAYIILDYMNKWLPHKHLATTSDAFGQAGESVHGATVYVRALPVETKEMIARGEVEDPQKFLRELPVDMEGDINRWYVLLGATNDHKQDQWHASSVTEATLKIVKEFEPQVETARLRSDNASCYHGTLYWLMLSNMETSTGIKVTECGMNEAGEGKDETDSSFNTAKAYVRRLVNLGKIDANTAVDFIAALNSGVMTHQCGEAQKPEVKSESAANTEMEMVSEDTQGEGQREPVTAEGATAAQAVAPQQVATRPDAPPAASNRRLENEQAKQRAVAAKRKAIFDASQENFAALKSLSPGGRAGYVKKLKVGPLKGLLMHFQDCADELPVGKKADFLASVLSFVEKMETSVAPTSGDMEMHGVPPVQQPQAQDANVIVACDPEVNRTETSDPDEGMDDEEEVSLDEDAEKSLVISFLKQFAVS
eukprot:gene12641-14943_t